MTATSSKRPSASPGPDTASAQPHRASSDLPSSGKSAFVTGTLVYYITPDGRGVLGTVVGPDQNYFPSPSEVFVSFPSTGFTHLLPVEDLKLR
ncbi:MAG: hypothetical protein LC776_05580 [Acidobacteria bacterium]|nr:hypothetical protein [Acidobacteriota bacterium]